VRAVLFFLCCLFASCSNTEVQQRNQLWRERNGKIKVLSTTAIIDDLVKQVGGTQIDSISLIKEDLDPHSYQLVKGDDEKMDVADIIFFHGLGLEHGPSLQHYLYNSPKAISLGNKIQEQSPERILHDKGQVDPHIWMDISLWRQAVPFIVEALSKHRPEQAAYFAKNGDQLMQAMDQMHASIREKLQQIPAEKRYLVTSHDAFNYFTRAYLAEEGEENWRKRFAAPEGLAPESQLSATNIQQIIDHLKRYQIHVLFPESNVSQDSIRKIIQAGSEKGLRLTIATTYLYGDAMGRPGSDGDTYFKMMQHNAATIERFIREAD
jgi:manganese/zinc/iron transport system substrate-binding protein